MIVSWNWLTEYLRLDMPEAILSERLALAGLNHESTAEVGGDLAIDLEVTSNRPDCLGHLGVAREIGVLFGRPVRRPEPDPATSGPDVASITSVTVDDPALCPRFTARIVAGVTVGPSPFWLRKRLETLGVRPISNVVDATNYVMFECGQPLHAYDLDRLDGRRLVVRRALAGETLVAINNKTYDLTPEMLAIADAGRPVGLAGVMGGAESEVSGSTRDVLIEAARFDPITIRRTSRALGLFSPASYRFERPIDPAGADWASRRCAEIILETAGGTLRPGLIDVGERPGPRPPITLRLSEIPRVLGITVDPAEVSRILASLGLVHDGGRAEAPAFVPPSWRSDLEREIDLIEEVARIHGYDQIPEDRVVPMASAPRSARERVEEAVRETLTGLGFDEAATFSLVAPDLAGPVGLDDAGPPIRVDHSSRRKENALRRSLVPSLVAARAFNAAHGSADAEFFEIADVYLPRPERPLPDQPTRLAIVSGRDFLDTKGVVEALLRRLHVKAAVAARPAAVALFVPGVSAELIIGGRRLGFVGQVEPGGLKGVDLRGPTFAAEIDLSALIDAADLVPQYRPLPGHPAVARDLSLVVPTSLPWAHLAGVVGGAAGETLESIVYLDAFTGGHVPDGHQSLHFGLRFRHPGRTLTGDEVDASVKAVVSACASAFEATLRT